MATVEIKNLNRLLKRLDNVKAIDLKPYVDKATLVVEKQAKALCDGFKYPTGALRSSIHADTKIEGNKIIGRVYTAMEYAQYVEFGTGIKGNGSYPYKVEGLSLSYRNTPWVYNDGENFWYTKGQEAKPFMYPALDLNKKIVNDLINKGYHDLLGKSIRGG